MDFQAVPCGRTCKLSVLLFEVGQYSNVNGVGCFLPNEWCGFPPDKQPPVLADGTHAFTSTGNGHFTIGVLAMHTEWVVRVVGTSVVASAIFHQVAQNTTIGQGAVARPEAVARNNLENGA